MSLKTGRDLTRRQFLRWSALGTGAVVLAACQPQTVEKIVKETVVVKEEVQKEVTKIVEKEKEVTKVVEKQVEKVVTPTSAPAGKTKIIYYDRHSDSARWGDAYNKAQDKVEVTTQIQPPNTRYEQLIAAITAGNAPDVIGLDCVQVGRFVQIGALVDLTDVLAKGVQDLYFPNLINRDGYYGRMQGKLYGVPFWVDLSACFYNKAMLKDAGGDPAVGVTQWSDYITYGQAAVKKGLFGFSLGGGGSAFLHWPWLWAAGADLHNKEFTAATIDQQIVRDWYKFIQDMCCKSKITNDAAGTQWGDMQNLFTSEKAMLLHNGGGLIGYIRKEFPKLYENLGVCGIPGPQKGQMSSFIGGNVAGVATQTKQKQASLDFLAWVTAGDGQAITADMGFMPGTPKALDLPPYKALPDFYNVFGKLLDVGYTAENHPRREEYEFTVNAATVRVQRCENIDEIVPALHAEIDKILKRQ